MRLKCSTWLERFLPFITLTLVLAVFSFSSRPAQGDIWFTLDATQFFNPDPQDIFFSDTQIRLPGSGGSNTFFDNPSLFGLMDGDNIDAFHHELRPVNSGRVRFFPSFVFTVDRGTLGLPGTDVNNQYINNAADFFESNGLGTNVLVASSGQIGVRDASDVDGFMLTPREEIDVEGVFYISLTRDSPTLSALGASPGDIIACRLNRPPTVAVTAAQLGLLLTDDLDGLVMVGGFDRNDDGDFDDASDTMPIMMFSVNPWARGDSGTAVRNEQATDGPVGADVFFSLGAGTNSLLRDEGTLGLLSIDDINGLDLPSLAVSEFLDDGSINPRGIPFTGGLSTPNSPPTGTPSRGLGCIVVGLCKTRASNGSCDITLQVETDWGIIRRTVRVQCDDCNDANGSELDQAVAALALSLGSIVAPNGQPLFAGVGAVNRTSPTHSQAILPVNRNANCRVTGLTTILNGCDCYTQNVEAKPARHVPLRRTRVKINTVGRNPGGLFMLQVRQDEDPYLLEIQSGPDSSIKRQLYAGLTRLGFTVIRDLKGNLCIIKCPNGRPCRGVFGAGFIEGGNGYLSIGVTWVP